MTSKTGKNQILIVDDQPENIWPLTQYLLSEFDVLCVTSGKEALEIAFSENRPDLILLDIMMPGMDGYQVCEKLKAEEHTRDIPVIFLTGKAADPEQVKGLDLGAQDYITKPFSLPVVAARIKSVLNLKKELERRLLLRTQLETLNRELERQVQQKQRELQAAREALKQYEEKWRMLFKKSAERKEPKCVLVVDDNPENVHILVHHLQAQYEVICTTSGKEALQIALSDHQPDIILLDIMMPEMDGFEVCSRLKANADTWNIPIIFITALGQEVDETKGLNLGAVDFVTKPFSVPVTKARIMAALRLKEEMDKRISLTRKLEELNRSLESRIQEKAVELEQAHEDLKASETKYRGIYENAIEGIFQCTPEGRFLDVSPSLAKSLGYASSRELVSTITDVAHQLYARPQDRDLFRHAFEEEGEIVDFETQFKKKNGDIIWVMISAKAIRDKNGDLIYFQGFAVDITERKRSEQALCENEERLRVIIQTAMDGFIICDLQGRLREVNESYCKMTGYSKQELLSMRIGDLEAVQMDDQIAAHMEILIERKELSFETRHRRKDGTLFDVEVSVQYHARNGGQVVSFLRDITQRKQAEEALKKHHDHLEELVAKRTTELAKAKEVAEAANSAKSDFLARMSHEIRTPLNAVTGLTNVVLKSDLTVEQRDNLNKVRMAANNLLEVINDILDFSKVEAGRLELVRAPFDLDQVLEQLADLFSNRVAQKDLELVFATAPDVPRRLAGDAGRLTQVLTNLVENAVKFTESGEIVVGVELVDREGTIGTRNDWEEGGAVLRFSVSDTGIGIAADVLPTLFEPFTQAEGYLNRTREGTGLGLAICRRLVEMMGGTITAQSTPGKGSTFAFTVMLAVQEAQRPGFRAPADLHGLKTLVVDDSTSARRVLVELLESFTFKVTAVDRGEKAIEALKGAAADAPYQLVLLDWKMPGLDGIETARRIRTLDFKVGESVDISSLFPDSSSLPIIILVTAYGHEVVQARIDTTQADTLLLKPVKASQLFNTIMELFNHAEAIVSPAERPRAACPTRLAGQRVLVVEDSALNRDVAVALLEEAGLAVDTAGNGKVAVDKVTQAPVGTYDAIFMDIQMPIMDGYQATRRIRQWEVNAHSSRVPRPWSIPIIALTAHVLTGEKDRCLAVGMNDYIAKPIDEQDLLRVLLKWISHPRKEA